LTRISTFSLEKVKSGDEYDTILPVPNSIRGLAFLSQLAVYKDLIPGKPFNSALESDQGPRSDLIHPAGYRIRELTAHEEAEKVRDEVRRLREGEKGLVKSYKLYLKTLETEIKREFAFEIRWHGTCS
jgi:nucleolar complex protein 3